MTAIIRGEKPPFTPHFWRLRDVKCERKLCVFRCILHISFHIYLQKKVKGLQKDVDEGVVAL